MEDIQILHGERENLAVCILFYERLEQTIECIKSFLPSGINIYVLNNGSSLLSRESLGRFCEEYRQVKIFDSGVNLGPSGGRNYLINHTTEEWLLSVDNDIFMRTDDWVERFVKHASSDNEVEVFIPKMFVPHLNTYAIPYSYKVEQNIAFPDEIIINDTTNTFPGGASFINRKLFNRLGLYDDKLFALEEFELSLRGIISGKPVKAKLIYDIELAHDHRPAKKKEDRKAVMVRYDINTLEKSYKRIADKHGIILKDYGRIGTVYNLEYMLNAYNPFSIYFWKQLIPKPVKRLLRDIEARIRRRAVPTFCTLFMTDMCNLKCHGCYRSTVGIARAREMTLPAVQRLLSLYPSINRFCIAGLGEPTLCSKFVEIVNFLKMIRKEVGIVTNGTNLDKLMALTYEPDYISMSLYGYNNDRYLSYTGVGMFNRVVENFLALKKRFKNIGLSYIVNKENYENLEKILHLCDDINPVFLDLQNYLAYDPDNMEEVSKIITVKDKEVISYIDKVCAGRGYLINKPVYVDLDSPKFRCRSYDYIINLDGSGNIGGCQRQIPPDSSFGNIFIDEDPFNSPEMIRLRKKMHKKSYIHKECSLCFGNWWKE